MHKPKKRSPHSAQKSVDWLEYLNDCLPGLVIPVGPRFQADVPQWTVPSNDGFLNGDLDSDTSKWLGTTIWPLQEDNFTITITGGGKIGNGRSDSCNCSNPGSSQCVHRHISEERSRLRADLGPAYKGWKFDEMGEDVAKSWSSKQRKKFDLIVKANPLSQDTSFLKPAELSFPSKTRKDIVSYYLNVYVPKRISMISRSGCKVLDSDDDEVEEAPSNAKNSLKRSRPVDNTTLVKSHYLTGRR